MQNYKLSIFVLLPLLFGWLINYTIVYLPIYGSVLWILSLVFIVYWFWVGRQFGQLKLNRLFSFMLGNAIWGISFGLFIWQFIFADDSNRTMFVAAMSQHYALFTIMPSTRFVMLFEQAIDSTQVVSVSYIFMIIIFVIGFISGWIKLNKSERNNISIEESKDG